MAHLNTPKNPFIEKPDFFAPLLPGGLTYEFMTWMRGELAPNSGSPILRLAFYDQGVPVKTKIVTINTRQRIHGTNWIQLGGQVTAPGAANEVRLEIFANQIDGWVMIDDVTLRELVEGDEVERSIYSLAGRPIAVRNVTFNPSGTPTADDLRYVLSDHLGSHSAFTDETGSLIDINGVGGANYRDIVLYEPFGAYRNNARPNDITGRSYTGHQDNDDIGLVYMNARYYVPNTNRFLSADSIVPDPTNPQNYNRYSYVRNSPLNFTDPTGHSECGVGQYHCEGDSPPPLGSSYPSDSGLFMEIIGDDIIVELFKLAYDHDLPREFIDHYANGSGLPMHLSESDMAELGVTIDLNEIDEFMVLVNQIAENDGGTASVSFTQNGGLFATNHGTLGEFSANFEGTLTVVVDESGNPGGWLFEGSVSFSDTYDFDPRPWGDRESRYAEVLTRVGDIYLPGRGFDIITPYTPLSQSSFQSEATWIGTGITGPLSRFAILINQ